MELVLNYKDKMVMMNVETRGIFEGTSLAFPRPHGADNTARSCGSYI
jgi:hypothetical protein